jgi:hypothetical protein
MYEFRERQKPLARILTRALGSDTTRSPMFGGLYVAATGRDAAREQAFTAGLFRRLIEEQNLVSWTPEAVTEEAFYQKWTTLGYIGVGVLAVVVLGVGFLLVRSGGG